MVIVEAAVSSLLENTKKKLAIIDEHIFENQDSVSLYNKI